jgi:hypothetical protein
VAYISEAFREALRAVFILVLRYGGHDERVWIGVAMRCIRHGSRWKVNSYLLCMRVFR